MNKLFKKVSVGVLAALMVFSTSIPALASTSYVNSVGSVSEDISVLSDSSYSAVGHDTTQNKKSSYANVELSDESVVQKCEIYATIAEGSKVYDPENPEADEDGFVDGSIIASLPTTIILSGTPDSDGFYKGNGIVKVKGNVSGNTVINIIPDNNVVLSSAGKTDIAADIFQQYTKFVVPDSELSGIDVNKNLNYVFSDECSSVIEIKTNQATAGSWRGNYNNTIYLSSVTD